MLSGYLEFRCVVQCGQQAEAAIGGEQDGGGIVDLDAQHGVPEPDTAAEGAGRPQRPAHTRGQRAALGLGGGPDDSHCPAFPVPETTNWTVRSISAMVRLNSSASGQQTEKYPARCQESLNDGT